MIQESRAVIFANGNVSNLAAVRNLLRQGDYLIAADGGSRHMAQLGRLPALLIGDLDSTPEAEVERLSRAGVRVERYPTAKDETDLELAIRTAVDGGYRQVVIVGALGGRLDQTLGNIALLGDPRFAGADLRLDDGREEVWLVRQETRIEGSAGDTVSLLPVGGEVRGVVTEGLDYPLQDETLYPYRTRGISNRLGGSEARVWVREGELICIHMRKMEKDEG
ncbi:MAG TPA: thiamine diphosphokinase [Armatimonadota bacterium]